MDAVADSGANHIRAAVWDGKRRLEAAARGLIHYARGHITVLDCPGPEQRTCECDRVVKKEYDRLQPTRSCRKGVRAVLL